MTSISQCHGHGGIVGCSFKGHHTSGWAGDTYHIASVINEAAKTGDYFTVNSTYDSDVTTRASQDHRSVTDGSSRDGDDV